MRFLVNPECYHKMCESCVERIFSHGPAPCPVAGCARTLRKARFRRQTFEDLKIEREVDIRRRVASVFNRREDEFESLRDWNNYLEEVENLTWNLLQGVDVKETEKKLDAYRRQNEAGIKQNAALESRETADAEARLAAQKEHARLRREAARNEELDERREKEEGKREILDRIANSDGGDVDAIVRETQKVVLKKSTARRTAAEKLRQQAADNNGAAEPLFAIQGLKRAVQAAPEEGYDPFGGYNVKPAYYHLRDHYEHSWLDNARSDAQITAGGYDVGGYCARAMLEAFWGFGVFVEDEVGGRRKSADKEVGTASAAAAAGGGGEGIDGDVL